MRLHGDRYLYYGHEVILPPSVGLGPRNSLLRSKYERDEAALILRHIGGDLPVIELGGSLGVVSRLIRARIGTTQRHIVVEANPALSEICAANAGRGGEPGATEFVPAAIAYDAATVRFAVHRDVHSSGIGATGPVTHVSVPAITLAQLVARLGSGACYALVSDIEGGEYEIFEREPEALTGLSLAILETHPPAYAASGRSEAGFLAMAEKLGLAVVDRSADVIVLRRLP